METKSQFHNVLEINLVFTVYSIQNHSSRVCCIQIERQENPCCRLKFQKVIRSPAGLLFSVSVMAGGVMCKALTEKPSANACLKLACI